MNKLDVNTRRGEIHRKKTRADENQKSRYQSQYDSNVYEIFFLILF